MAKICLIYTNSKKHEKLNQRKILELNCLKRHFCYVPARDKLTEAIEAYIVCLCQIDLCINKKIFQAKIWPFLRICILFPFYRTIFTKSWKGTFSQREPPKLMSLKSGWYFHCTKIPTGYASVTKWFSTTNFSLELMVNHQMSFLGERATLWKWRFIKTNTYRTTYITYLI